MKRFKEFSMFDPRDNQLADLEIAYTAFMETVRNLSPENFLAPLGDWTPRDNIMRIAANMIENNCKA
jgi:hypothetical protein